MTRLFSLIGLVVVLLLVLAESVRHFGLLASVASFPFHHLFIAALLVVGVAALLFGLRQGERLATVRLASSHRVVATASDDSYAAFAQRNDPAHRSNFPSSASSSSTHRLGAVAQRAVAAARPQASESEAAPAPDLDELLRELHSQIGLDGVKKQVEELVAVLEVQAQRRAQGLKVSPMSNHLVLLGAPGTGKTTIARLLGQIMHTLGLLENRHFVEGDRESLVGQHIGESAIKTKALIESAMGGVLFIDEAYSLDPKSNGYSADPFAAEAIATLLKAMEDDRGAFVVMVAGYDKPMQKFLSSNEGLRSRFARTLHFADYTPNELTTIADKMVADADYRWTLDGREAFERGLFYLLDHKDESWANAREVRTLVEHMQRAHAVRIKRVGGRRTRKELRELTTVDVRSAITAFADERQPAAASALRSGSRLTEAQHSS